MATKKDDGVQAGLYKSYSNDNSYVYVSGLMVLPVASASNTDPNLEPPAPIVVRVSQPYTLRKQSFSASKDQNPPLLPGPEAGQTLLSSTVAVPLPKIGGSGVPTYNWTVAGEYVYLSSRVITPKTGYPGGSYPMAFPEVLKMQDSSGFLGGKDATATDLGKANIDVTSGTYYYPFTTLPAALFEPLLSTSV